MSNAGPQPERQAQAEGEGFVDPPSAEGRDFGGAPGISEEVAPYEGASAEEAGPAGTSGESGPSEAERQRDDYYDRLLRLQAEFDNYRKRIERQQKEMVDNAAVSLVNKLLPVLDTADLALAHGGGEEVKQVAGALFDVLAKEGLVRIVPEGQPFDPAHHDAVAHEPAEDDASGGPEVSEVLRAGYEWRGRSLRPAMVKVRG